MMERKPDVIFKGLELKCPGCGSSKWEVIRAGARLFCQKCWRTYKLVEVEER